MRRKLRGLPSLADYEEAKRKAKAESRDILITVP